MKKNENKKEKTAKNKNKNSQVSSKENINDVFDAESSTSEKAMAFENKERNTSGSNKRRILMVIETLVFVALVVGTTYYIKKK